MKKLLLCLLFVLFACSTAGGGKVQSGSIMTYEDMLNAEEFIHKIPADVLSKKIQLSEIDNDDTNAFVLLEENGCAINMKISKTTETSFDVYFDFVESATDSSYTTYSLSPCFTYPDSKVISEGAVDIVLKYKLENETIEQNISYTRLDENDKPNVQYQITLPEELFGNKNNEIVLVLETYFLNEGRNK